MSDDDFLERLETCLLREDEFHHADHLHAAWLYLTRLSPIEAIANSAMCCAVTQSIGQGRPLSRNRHLGLSATAE